ncbi:hypothetical protein GJ744_009549 [Endocarpon pusillum]|uniref:Secreted protein n=1 Tax=Endocarpon pusillum TaxID=364733 RepID=A0A8H7E4R8_9EURO|nr:hypothetical protein GJ744_009549 [Endocarpon pusillum]
MLCSAPQVLLLHFLEGSTTSLSTASSSGQPLTIFMVSTNKTPSSILKVTMSYGFDTKRDEAYTERPLSSGTMTLMRVAGKARAIA